MPFYFFRCGNSFQFWFKLIISSSWNVPHHACGIPVSHVADVMCYIHVPVPLKAAVWDALGQRPHHRFCNCSRTFMTQEGQSIKLGPNQIWMEITAEEITASQHPTTCWQTGHQNISSLLWELGILETQRIKALRFALFVSKTRAGDVSFLFHLCPDFTLKKTTRRECSRAATAHTPICPCRHFDFDAQTHTLICLSKVQCLFVCSDRHCHGNTQKWNSSKVKRQPVQRTVKGWCSVRERSESYIMPLWL